MSYVMIWGFFFNYLFLASILRKQDCLRYCSSNFAKIKQKLYGKFPEIVVLFNRSDYNF